MAYNDLPTKETIEKTISALNQNGFEAEVFEGREELIKRVLEIIPSQSEVMNMTSVTVDTLGLMENYESVKSTLANLEPKRKRELGAAPDFALGSVHGVSEDGHVLIASRTGSQLPAYVFGAEKVVWIVGTQKIVKDVQDGIKRIYEYTLPLESERAHKAYGVEGSAVSKLLILNEEVNKGRITLLFLNENIGF